MNNITLGQRIKYFRKRAGMSQLELETLIGTSSGSLSRIENGEVNPTKETLEKIKKVLSLNSLESAYLDGPLSQPATEEEYEKVRKEVEPLFSRKGVIAYILDDRWRLIIASKTMQKLMQVPDHDLKNILNHSMIEILLNDNLGINRFLKGDDYENLLFYQLCRFYYSASFMFDDPLIIQAHELINSNPVASRIWKTIDRKSALSIFSQDERTVKYNISGLKFTMKFFREPLQKYPRFDLIDFVPDNIVLKLISKL